jgi:hypothetical protein
MIKGKHDIKMGIGIRANQMNVRSVGFQDGFWVMNGAYSGSPMADMIQGLSNIRIHDQNFNGDVTGRRWKNFRPYVQDDWRVTKDLTLNIGVAWSMSTPVSESADRLANLVPSEGKMLVAGQNGVSSSAGVQMDWTALEPRIGLAYKLFGSDKTAIRAGYAIFHDSSWSQGAQGLGRTRHSLRSRSALCFSRPSPIPLSVPSPPLNAPSPSISSLQSDLAPLDWALGRFPRHSVSAERHRLVF